MRRVRTPVTHRLAMRAHTAFTRAQSTAAAATVTASSNLSPAAALPATIKIRSRGYGPSRDLVVGLPDHAVLSVEATLHPEDAAVQRAVLALAMPTLSEVHVTPVVPHDRYVSKVPSVSGAGGYTNIDVLSPTEREVMEQCLQEQLADVANLVVQQVGLRTGQQLDALQVSHTDEMRNFAEIILHSIQDELRQLRLSRSAVEKKKQMKNVKEEVGEDRTQPYPSSNATPVLDVETVANVVSARVMERLESVVMAAQAPTAGTVSAKGINAEHDASFAHAALSALGHRTAAYFEQLQSQVQKAVNSGAMVSHAAPAAIDELRAAVTEAVETASHTQQENLANLVNDWLADMQRNTLSSNSANSSRSSDGAAAAAAVDMRVLEEMVESAVQTSTDELRRVITGEVRKLVEAKSSIRARAADDGGDPSELLVQVEKVFDLVQSTQGRLTAVDEVVGDVFKEQAATREALRTIQELLEKQLSEVRATSPESKSASDAATAVREENKVADATTASPTTIKAIEDAVASLQREVAAASAFSTLYQEETQQQLMTVAQVVSDSVAAAVQQHTAEAVQSAMGMVQQQLETLAASARAGVEAVASAAASATAAATAAAAANVTNATPENSTHEGSVTAEMTKSVAAPAVEPLSREIVAEAVEAVLTPRWSSLAAEIERVNEANQLAVGQQLLHMANSVAASVTATLQEQLTALRVQSERAEAAVAAVTAKIATEKEADTQKRAEETKTAAVSAVTILAEKTREELTNLRGELMSTLQTEMSKTHEVDLSPMYKYIDSVLTFIREELNLQETNLTAKMTSLSDSVTAAVRDAQERSALPFAQEASAAAVGPSTTASTVGGNGDEGGSPKPSAADESDKMAASSSDKASGVAAAPPPTLVTLEVPASLTNTLDLQSSALRHLEERLNEINLSRSRDTSLLLSRLQEVTESFRAATSAPPPSPTPSPPHPVQLTWQSNLTAQLTTLSESAEKRDAELLAAVRALSTVRDKVKAQLTQIEGALKMSSHEEREALQTALQDIVSSNAQEQSSRVEALVQRVAEMHGALRDQSIAVQLLQPSVALRGLTAEQQAVQARIRTDTQEHLRRITSIVETMTGGNGGKQQEQRAESSTAAAQLQTELVQLRALQDEEAQLNRSAAVATTSADATATVESIVREEITKAQTALQGSVCDAATHTVKAQRELASTVETLLAKVSDISDSTSSIPSITDVQQLLDAAFMRLAAEQKDTEMQVTQLVAQATATATAEMKSVVQSTLSESVAASVEQRILPAYHNKMEASLQSRLAEQAATVTAAVAGVTEHTVAAFSKLETLVRDFNAQRADETQKVLADQYTKRERLAATMCGTAAHLPVWWMLVNALLVCVVVLLSLYYVFACLLLAFVPKPSDGSVADNSPLQATDSSREVAGVDAEPGDERKVLRGGRYVDRYM